MILLNDKGEIDVRLLDKLLAKTDVACKRIHFQEEPSDPKGTYQIGEYKADAYMTKDSIVFYSRNGGSNRLRGKTVPYFTIQANETGSSAINYTAKKVKILSASIKDWIKEVQDKLDMDAIYAERKELFSKFKPYFFKTHFQDIKALFSMFNENYQTAIDIEYEINDTTIYITGGHPLLGLNAQVFEIKINSERSYKVESSVMSFDIVAANIWRKPTIDQAIKNAPHRYEIYLQTLQNLKKAEDYLKEMVSAFLKEHTDIEIVEEVGTKI